MIISSRFDRGRRLSFSPQCLGKCPGGLGHTWGMKWKWRQVGRGAAYFSSSVSFLSEQMGKQAENATSDFDVLWSADEVWLHDESEAAWRWSGRYCDQEGLDARASHGKQKENLNRSGLLRELSKRPPSLQRKRYAITASGIGAVSMTSFSQRSEAS